MTIMLLNSDNLSSLKKLCSSTYPSLKSSHITEAIARGLGFGSHAALLSALKASTKPKLKYVEFDQQRFCTWIHEKNPLPVDPFPLHAFTNLPIPVFRRISGKPPSRLGQKNAWFCICKDYNIPYVYIEQKTKYCSVEWDYISVDEYHDPDKFTREDLSAIENLARTYGGEKMKFEFSVMTGSIEGLSLPSAEIIAMEIFKILHALISESMSDTPPILAQVRAGHR